MWAVVVTSWVIAPEIGVAQEDRGRGSDLQPDPCEQLAEVPGRAEGLDKRCQAGSSSGVARGDFNGDGFADLAIGVPQKDTPSSVPNSGAVYVIYGSATGLIPAGQGDIPPTQFWSQNTAGVPGTSTANDMFGTALAAGEFNGDDFSDLAIGIPGEEVGGEDDTGRVVVLQGSSAGLTTTNAKSFNLFDIFGDSGGAFLDSAELGSALAWGDFDGDGVGDLAIGAPEYDFIDDHPVSGQIVDNGGLVWVLFGEVGTGLTTAGTQTFRQDSVGGGEEPEDDDQFGEVLAAGNFNGGARTDLAIGTPHEDLEIIVNGQVQQRFRDTGGVHVLFGAATGLLTANSRLFTQDDFDRLPGADDELGSSLAAADFDGEGSDDLAIGMPGGDVENATNSGFVLIADGELGAATALAGQATFNQDSLNGGSEAGDRFGYALATGNFDADGFADLAIGVPYEDVAGASNAGVVNVVYGSSDGLAFGSSQQFRQGSDGLGETAQQNDLFGSRLTAWNFGRNERTFTIPPQTFRTADLAVGVPLEDVLSSDGTVVTDVGAVHVLYGSRTGGLSTNSDQLFFQSNIGGFTSVAGDRFGLALY